MIAQSTISYLLSFCPSVASLRLNIKREHYHSDIWDISIIKEFLSMNSLVFIKNFCPKTQWDKSLLSGVK